MSDGLSAILAGAVEKVLRETGAPEDLPWKLLRPSEERWDVSTNAALTWAARTGGDAAATARLLSERLPALSAVSECAAEPPGFVHIRMNDRVLEDAALLCGEGEGEPEELPLLDPGHPLAAGPPLLRRLKALEALGACPATRLNPSRPEARRLLLRLAGVETAAEPALRLAAVAESFEDCHRIGMVTPALCGAVRRTVRAILEEDMGGLIL